MIINFHPQEKESKRGQEIIARLNPDNTQKVFRATEKTSEEWKAIINSDEELILVAPTYWWGLGYEFEKWLQNVITYDFAYKYNEQGSPEGLLNGRIFELHITHGTPEVYAKNMRENIKQRLEAGIFGFCNAKADIKFYDPKA